MAGYPGLGRLTDPATISVCKTLFDLTGQLLRRLETLEAAALQAGDAAGQRLSQVGRPTALDDAVTVAYLREYVAAHTAPAGVSGTVDTATAQVVTVSNGSIVKIV